MSDTLLGFVQAMNGVPDNTSRLVSPQDARQAWLSLTADRGLATMDNTVSPVTIPLVVNVWTDIPQGIITGGGAMVQGQLPLFWRMDLNGHLGYDYTADWPTTIVPPGYQREVVVHASIEMDLLGANDIYEFAITQDGVPVPPSVGLEEGSSQAVETASVTTAIQPIVADAPRVSMAVRNISASNGLDVIDFGYLVQGGPPA